MVQKQYINTQLEPIESTSSQAVVSVIQQGDATLKITFSPDKPDLWDSVKNSQKVMILEIDSRQWSPNFLESDDFYSTLNSVENLFFVDIAIDKEEGALNEAIKAKLKTIKRALIIQCASLSNTKVYVKEYNEQEPIVVDLNADTGTDTEPLTDDKFIDELLNLYQNKKSGLPLIVKALQLQQLIGKFKEEAGQYRSLTKVNFDAKKEFNLLKLIDHIVEGDDFLSTRLLSTWDWDWDLTTGNSNDQRTLEIAAEHASVNVLAALLKLQLPLPVGKIVLPEEVAILLTQSDLYDHNTPLLIAAKNGKQDNVDFFIKCNSDINYINTEKNTAIDLAWKHEHYSCVLLLLKAGSNFPNVLDKPFKLEENDEDCNVPKELREFLDHRKTLSIGILQGDLEEVKKFVLTHSTSVYLENSRGKSEIVKFALEEKQYGIYAFFKSRGNAFQYEEEHTYINSLSDAQRDILRVALLPNFPQIDDAHIIFLLSRSRPNESSPVDNRFKDEVRKLYEDLNKIPEIAIILKVLQYSDYLDIVIDFNQDNVTHVDPTGEETTKGKTHLKEGRIYLGAKGAIGAEGSNEERSEVLGTFAHEFTHYAMQIVYNNDCNPYDKSDNERKKKFKKITENLLMFLTDELDINIEDIKNVSNIVSQTCQIIDNKSIDDIITRTFTSYKKFPEEWPSELVVRVPHVLAKYGKRKEESERTVGREKLEKQVPELLKYFEKNVIPDCERFINEYSYLIKPRNNILLLNQYSGITEKINETEVKLKEQIDLKGFFENKNKQMFLLSTQNTWLSSINVHQSLQKIPTYSSRDSYLFFKYDHYIKKQIDINNAFFSEVCNLLVINNPSNSDNETLSKLFAILNKKLNKKIIFIIHESKKNRIKETMASLIKVPLDNYVEEQTDEEFTLNDLEDKSQIELLKKKVTFQGEKISLNELIDDKKKEKIVDAQTLSNLINNREVKIADKLPDFKGYNKNYYINRTFNYQTEIKREIFKEVKGKYLLAISGTDKASLSRLAEESKICSFQEYDSDKANPIGLIILDNQEAEEQFKQLCQQHQELNIHWLRSESGHLMWQQSQGSLSGLRKYIEKNESHKESYSESELLDQTDKHKVVIISDTAGMGKSTILTTLGKEIKKRNPSLWLVRIDLNNYTDELNKQKKQKEKDGFNSINTIEAAVQFLGKDLLKLDTHLEQALFKHYCQHTGKIIIMFDGFDEITPHYRDIVIDLAQILKNSLIKQLWITTRPNEKEILEDNLQEFAYTLQHFSEGNQVEFLTSFWKQKLEEPNINQRRLEIFAKALIKLLTKSIDKDKKFTGIPLHTRMLAEAFEMDFEKFYQSNEAEPKLPEKFNLIDLYDTFLKNKYDIYQVEKNNFNLNQPRVKMQYDESYSYFKKQHQNMALYMLFGEEIADKLLCEKKKDEIQSYINDIEESKVNTGIIDGIIEHKPQFIHRTFAEYLVVTFFIANLENKAIAEFILKEILMKQEYQVIRAFFNSQLAREPVPQSTSEIYGSMQANFFWQSDPILFNNKDRSILHIAVMETNEKVIDFLLNPLEKYPGILERCVNKKNLNEQTVLHFAVSVGTLEIIERLVEKGADVNAKDKDGNTVLHMAASSGNLDVVKWLEKKGADVNAKNSYGETVLHMAAKRDKWDVVKFLAEEKGADVNAKNSYGETVLHMAAESDKWDVVKFLAGVRGVDVNAKNSYGKTVLHSAANSYKWDLVKWLSGEKGADVNASDNYGQTVLHKAASSGNLEVVQWLAEKKGADVNAKSKDGQTVLHKAAGSGNLEVVKWLVEEKGADVNAKNRYGETVLHMAAKSNKWDVVKWLAEEKSAHVDAKDRIGATVLHMAASSGNLEVVKWLAEEKGANINGKDKDGNTVLHMAASSGNLEVVQWLAEEKGADVNAKSKDGQTVLHKAAGSGNLEVVQWLAEKKGADVNAKSKDGQTVLHKAAGSGNLEVVKWLVEEKGADVNAKNRYGETVLHMAAKSNKWDVVKWLAEEKGADVNAKDKDGKFVLHRPALWRNWDAVKYLAGVKGVDVNVKGKDGKTVLHIAAESNKWDVVKWLAEEKGADVNAKYEDGNTVLHRHARWRKWDVVIHLAGVKGVDVNVKGKDGKTVLHIAAEWGQWDGVKWLVEEKGADVNAKDKYGQTVLHMAAELYKWDVVKWLAGEKGADVNAKNSYGETVLHMAAKRDKWDVVKWLAEEKGADVNAKNSYGETVLQKAAQLGNLDVVKGAYVNAKDKDGKSVLHGCFLS